MKKPILILFIFALLGYCLAAFGKTEEKGPGDKVTLQLKWFHQAQFAGFYLAAAKGSISNCS